MINLSTEQAISLATAAKTIPGRPDLSTVWRWATKGVRGVRLDTICVGGKRFTSTEAVLRFIDASTAAANPSPQPSSRTPAQRQRAVDRAKAELAKHGI